MFNTLIKFTKDYIDLTVSEPYSILKTKYAAKTNMKANTFSLPAYIRKQKKLTSPEISNYTMLKPQVSYYEELKPGISNYAKISEIRNSELSKDNKRITIH